ncbi:hypothetical protein [Gracilimonas sp.]|uniref:hypothetical protein n=1 Tax=Gracilimonas sp. TaxID=1974203 RepID=UPI003BAD790E
MSTEKSKLRDMLVSFLTYSFMLGGAWLLFILLEKVLTYFFPDLLPLSNLSLLEIALALISIFLTLFFGMIIGLLFLLTIVRPFYEKDEMVEFIKPHVPIISTILLRHIDSMYS